uniref:Uncharacterized protein n=1 Tax=Globodera rostochiensis TaxID=31243 RepID=A0A914H8G1_GLORO
MICFLGPFDLTDGHNTQNGKDASERSEQFNVQADGRRLPGAPRLGAGTFGASTIGGRSKPNKSSKNRNSNEK